MAAIVTTGITISFGTSAWVAQILRAGIAGRERPSIDVAHMGTTGGRPKTPGKLYEPGKLELDVIYDPDTEPPISAVPETITMTFPKKASASASGHIKAFNGFIMSVDSEMPLEDKMTAKITIQKSGNDTDTAEV